MSSHTDTNAAETVEGDTTFAALSHASALIASFLGPLLFLTRPDDNDKLVKQNVKNSLNFQRIIFIAMVVSRFLTVALVALLFLSLID